jgi:predicted metallopeptidase
MTEELPEYEWDSEAEQWVKTVIEKRLPGLEEHDINGLKHVAFILTSNEKHFLTSASTPYVCAEVQSIEMVRLPKLAKFLIDRLAGGEIRYILFTHPRYKRLTPHQKQILFHHEALHFTPNFDGTVVPHDVEDFFIVLKTYGELKQRIIAELLEEELKEIEKAEAEKSGEVKT